MTNRKPDFEIELTQEQLQEAAGDYCADRLRRIPSGKYEATQLSVITNSAAGTLRAVFRAWAPPGMLLGPFSVSLGDPAPAGVYAGDGHPQLRRVEDSGRYALATDARRAAMKDALERGSAGCAWLVMLWLASMAFAFACGANGWAG